MYAGFHFSHVSGSFFCFPFPISKQRPLALFFFKVLSLILSQKIHSFPEKETRKCRFFNHSKVILIFVSILYGLEVQIFPVFLIFVFLEVFCIYPSLGNSSKSLAFNSYQN